MLTILVFLLLLYAGGKPTPGTKADMRLKINNPNAGKRKSLPVSKPVPPKKGKS